MSKLLDPSTAPMSNKKCQLDTSQAKLQLKIKAYGIYWLMKSFKLRKTLLYTVFDMYLDFAVNVNGGNMCIDCRNNY